MGIARNMLLWASRNQKLREALPRYRFIQKSVKRFMPGEEIKDALDASETLNANRIPTIITHLGENVGDEKETFAVRDHYIDVLDQIGARNLKTQISVKLTELGLDQSLELCIANLNSIAVKASGLKNFVWIDMEGSKYTEKTIEVFRRMRPSHENLGLCLQSYLYRTAEDLAGLLSLSPAIRLVKGAYAEPAEIAYPQKRDNDENYFRLAQKLLESVKERKTLPGFATHDAGVIRRIREEAKKMNVPADAYEIQMLYGIRSDAQQQLVSEGAQVRVLISYGSFWFPWYMRRLAERPANVWFVLRNLG